MKNIAIFGGTFNPIHKGHVKIAKEAIKTLDLDKIFFVPCYQNPFKNNKSKVNHNHIVNMINLNLEDKMELSLFEINRKGPSYTIETIKYFKQQFPEDNLYLIIGSDNLKTLNKWKDIAEIAKLSKICVFKRTKDINKTNIKKYQGILLNNTVYPYSSTDFKHGELNVCSLKTRKYIGEHFLYASEIAKNTQEAKRYKHSIAAADMAILLAKNTNYNINTAYYAGLMHDITKNWDKSKHRHFLVKHGIDEKQIADFQLHQLTGSIWLEKEFFVTIPDVYHAVSVHTTLAEELSLLDKIVFVADKICEGRKYDGIQQMRHEAIKGNFEEAFKNVVLHTKVFNLEKTAITEEQSKIYAKWSQ